MCKSWGNTDAKWSQVTKPASLHVGSESTCMLR